MTWLLVEDDPDIRTVVAVMMQLWGETALALPDGNAAWKWLDTVDGGATHDLPELALMDIRMPGHTGDQIAARIRQTEKIKHIPIILMTAFSLTDAEVSSMKEKAGIDHLIKKPLPDMDDFKSTLYRVRDEKRSNLTAAPAVPATPAAPPTPNGQPAAIAPIAPQTPAAPANAAPAPVPVTPPPTPPTQAIPTPVAPPAPASTAAPAQPTPPPTAPVTPAPTAPTQATAPATNATAPQPAPQGTTPAKPPIPNRDTKPLK